MGKKQSHAWCLKKVAPRHLEVCNAIGRKCVGDAIGIGVGTDDNGRRASRFQFADLLADEAHLVIERGTIDDLECARGSFLGVVGDGEQFGIDTQLALGIPVEHLEQVAGHAVVLSQVMDMTLAAELEFVETLHFCAHKGKDGLLLVA